MLSCALMLCAAQAASAARMRIRVPEKAHIGQPFFLEMRFSEPVGDVTIQWMGQSFRLRPKNACVRTVLGIPNDKKHVGKSFSLIAEFDCGSKGRIQAERTVRAVGHSYPKQVLKVKPAMVTPPKDQLKRIAAEQKQVRRVLSTHSLGGVLPLKYARSVPGIPTARYGGFRVYNNVPRAGHSGLDLRAAVGTPVKSVADGTVVLTGFHYYSGGAVYVDHGGGVVTAYFHLSKIKAKPGDRVRAGTVLALSGATGRVTGPHLHQGLFCGNIALDILPLWGEAPMAPQTETFYEF